MYTVHLESVGSFEYMLLVLIEEMIVPLASGFCSFSGCITP